MSRIREGEDSEPWHLHVEAVSVSDVANHGERQSAAMLEGIRPDHRRRYEFAARYLRSGQRVLDIACGCGYGSAILAASCREISVDGVDRSSEAVEFARAHYGGPSVTYHLDDAHHYSGKSGYDFLVSLESIEHFSDSGGFLRNLHSLAKPDATLVISTPNEVLYPYDPTKNPHHIRHYTPDQLTSLLEETGWRVIERWCQQSKKSPEVEQGVDGRYLLFVAKKRSIEAVQDP